MTHSQQFRIFLSLALLVILSGSGGAAVDFEMEIWPLLEAKCLSCHAPQSG